MKVKPKLFLQVGISLLSAGILGGAIYGNYMCYIHRTEITTHLVGTGVIIDADKAQEALLSGDELVQKIADEGIVLLKNEKCLPLSFSKDSKYKINLFGVGATADGFAYTGVGGSGVATIIKDDILDSDGNVLYKKNRVTPQEGFEAAGFEVNKELLEAYKDGNPNSSFYSSSSVLDNAKKYSDTAVIFITRATGENYKTTELYDEKDNGIRINESERAMIDYVKSNFEKTIVVINSTNTMELGFVDDDSIDACLYIGVPGQSGVKSLARIIKGEVNPSGKTTATFAYDVTKDPTYVNAIREGGGNGRNQINYAEDIYLGYKWYETADHEGYFNDVNNEYGQGYEGVVQYPFGYGLSYSDFSYSLKDAYIIDGDTKTDIGDDNTIKDSEASLEVIVTITNNSEVAGKESLQCYIEAPYYDGEIEKPYLRLVSYGKSEMIEPHQSKDVTLTFDAYDFASYDYYDKNNNGFSGWELDPGFYNIKIMKSAHQPSEIEDIEITVPESETVSGRRGYIYRFDKDTNGYVRNRFTGEKAEAGIPIDGNSFEEDPKITYLSRSDFKGTFPKTKLVNRNEKIVADTFANWYYQGFDEREDSLEIPSLEQDSGLLMFTLEDGSKPSYKDLENVGRAVVANEDLIMELGSNYDSKKWEQLLSQMSVSELNDFIAGAGFGTKPVESIGKPNLLDYDGSSGFNHKMASGERENNAWTGYGSEFLLAQTYSDELAFQVGQALGKEAKVTGNMTGIYAPTVNLQRTPFNTRNYEAYSEDGVLSGYMAANLILGAKSQGLSCYLKHLVLSEPGWNPNDLATWLTEQNLRENYLKPFEIAVKKGKANAIMSAFNCIGAVRCCNSYSLLTDILRKEWGFKGSVITDYNMGQIYQHVRAGNDLHLNPNEGTTSWLNADDKAAVYCALQAVKNSLFTYCETQYYAKNYDESASITTAKKEDLFEWWIPLLVVVDVLIVGGIATGLFFTFKPKKKTAKEE